MPATFPFPKCALLLLAFLCLSLGALGQSRARVTGYYYYLENSEGEIIEKRSHKISGQIRYVYFNQSKIRIDDDGGSVYYLTSDVFDKETPQYRIIHWNAVDDKEERCKVGLVHSKQENKLCFFADYEEVGFTRSFNYHLLPVE